MKLIHSLVLVYYFWGFNTFAGVYVTEALIKRASNEMTSNEMERIKTNVKDRIAAAKAAGDTVKLARYESISKDFFNGKYDLVLQQFAAFGENTRHMLHITELRDRMLAGALEKAPLLAQEVAALDLFFANDAKESIKTWPSDSDKALYLLSLAAKIGQTKSLMLNVPLLETVTDDLGQRLEELKKNVSDPVVQQKIRQGLWELSALRKMRSIRSL